MDVSGDSKTTLLQLSRFQDFLHQSYVRNLFYPVVLPIYIDIENFSQSNFWIVDINQYNHVFPLMFPHYIDAGFFYSTQPCG